MGFGMPVQSYKIMGVDNVTRLACSFSFASTTTIRQIAFNAARYQPETLVNLTSSTVPTTDPTTMKWEIRTGTGATAPAHSPKTGEATDGTPDGVILLDTGIINLLKSDVWKLNRAVHYTINLNNNLNCTAGTEYFLVLRLLNTEVSIKYPIIWYTTATDGEYAPVATTYDSYYSVSGTPAWSVGDNTLNLSLEIPGSQAGVEWNVVIDGKGFMSPDAMKSATKETISSGIASTRGGQSEYSQLRYPYSSMSQSTWTSGTGQLNMDDQAAYLYGLALDTRNPNQMIIGPQPHETGMDAGLRTVETGSHYGVHIPEEYVVTTPCTYFAQPFIIGDSQVVCTTVGLFCAKLAQTVGNTLRFTIVADSSGSPASLVGATWATVTAPAPYYWIKWVDTAYSKTLSASTKYWLVVNVKASDNPDLPPDRFGYSVGFNTPAYAGGSPKKSTNGTTWAAFGKVNDADVYMEFRVNYGIATPLNGNVYTIKYGEVSASYSGSGSGNAYLIATAGRKAYKWDTTTNYWVDISTGIGGVDANGASVNLAQANLVDSVFFNGKLICTQSASTVGYDRPMRVWDGTNWGPASATNLLSNGTFDSATTGWTAENATLSSEAGGQSGNYMKILNTGAASGRGYASATTVSGKWYELIFYAKNGAGDVAEAVQVKIGTGTTGTTIYDKFNMTGSVGGADAWTRYSVIFLASSTTTYISFYVGTATANDYAMVDTVGLYSAPVGKILHIGKGYVWASNSPNTVMRSNNGTTWTADITIGENIYAINDFANFQGNLLVGKEDGIWSVDDNDLALEYLVFREHAQIDNCAGMCVWSGMLFIPVQNSLWRWQGSQYKEIGPNDKRNGPAKYWPNKISRLVSTAPFLYACTAPVVTGGVGGIIAYDGMGWHHLTATTYADRTSYAICATSEIGTSQNRIWWGEGTRIFYITQPTFTNNRYDWTSADYDLSGVFVSSWFDGGVKDAMKYWNRLTLLGDVPEGTSIEVYCAKDGEEWETATSNLSLGVFTAFSKTSEGEYTVMFPDELTAKSIQLIFILRTTSASKTPRVRAFNLEAAVRQPPVYSYSTRVLLADRVTKMSGAVETARTGRAMELELEAIEASEAPVTFSWPDMSIRGFVSFQRVNTEQYAPEGTMAKRFDKVAQLSIIEAK